METKPSLTARSRADWDRRLAAATGHPSGINDSVIEQDLPTDCIGFTPAAPMRTSIKLARVYGLIITGNVLFASCSVPR